MVLEPKGAILSVVEQCAPENHAVVDSALQKALPQHENVDCVCYDRNCSFCVKAKNKGVYKNVKTWAIDTWHAKKHCKNCACSPENHLSIKRRLRGVNTSVCEQTFSWFRNYARTMNELRPLRHRFLVLFYAKRHNELVAQKDFGCLALSHVFVRTREPLQVVQP